MRRVDHWTREYDRRRFLSNFSAEALGQRFDDIIANSVALRGVPPRLAAHADEPRMRYWGRKLTHVSREFEHRGVRPSSDLRAIPLATDPKAQRAARVCADWGMPPKGCLIKYGERRYLREFVEHGRLLLRPASFYRSTDLAQGIRDDELQFDRTVAADRMPSMTVYDGKSLQVKATGVRPFSMTQITRMETDFYLYCASLAWDPRLFLLDPRYDAAVVIHSREVLQRVDREVRRNRAEFIEFPPFEVDYVDPVEATDADCHLPLVKHFRFSFQQEARAVWVPVAFQPTLPEITVEVGDLRGQVTLVCL
ncbi:MAG: hypothetical protein JNK49_08440 [Planctomycetes bacterium]|nr:hypothetical protein [Planctomycetota bacterium]